MSRRSAKPAASVPVPLKGNPSHTRSEHALETAEDYVEIIAELIATAGEARVTNLARRLGVTHVTVNRTIRRLQLAGLVNAKPYRSVSLTEAGRKLSEQSRRRHEIVVEFLKSLGVPDSIAHLDAEGIEHHVSKPTLGAFLKHLRKLSSALVAIGLGLGAASGFAQGNEAENSSKPLLTLAPAEPSPPGGANSGVTNAKKGELDLNDPRVAAAISEAMDNPISELIVGWNQFDAIQAHFPRTRLYDERDLWAYRYQFMPTIPVPLGERWNWVSRLDLPVVSVPLKSEVGRLFQFDPGGNLRPDGSLPADLDPFGRTTGLGDFLYLGLVGPKHLPKVGGGKLFLAAGPTIIFPSASEDILGQGKWQAGPAFAAGFLTEHWRLGVFPQQWWSFAGDDHRADVSQLNLQYFLYYAPTPEWEIGMSPNMFVNWNAPSGNRVTFPVGLGVHRLINIGKLPVSIGIEASYSVIHPSELPGSRWNIRFTLMPLLPAPWSHLAKELKALE